MKKVVLISAIVATGLFADMMTDMATDAVKSKATSEAKSMAVKEIAGGDALKTEVANQAADKVLGKEDPVDKLKSDALGSVMGGKTSETSLQDKAVDMAADEASKAVGKETLSKETAKTAIKSVL
ncbi:MAG: hypothetical protein U9O64_05760 [Campylobacterota bacterium]|nr:hypothetical protein [Campylobacterota bacterium]